MSELESSDLVCKARRGSLTDHEQRRLEDALRTSVETRLVTLVQLELDRESGARPGDEAIVVRMVASATKMPVLRARRSHRMHAWLAAAAVLLLGAVASAWWRERAFGHQRNQDGPTAPAQSTSGLRSPKALGAHAARTNGGPEAPSAMGEEGTAPIVVPAPPSAMVEGVATQPAAMGSLTAGVDVPAPPGEGVESSIHFRTAGERAGESHIAGRRGRDEASRGQGTAATRFAQANALRRDGRTGEALALYRSIIETFPRARESPLSRLAVAKLLQGPNPKQALVQYQMLATQSGSLRAEGLWGVAECARALGQVATSQEALSALSREFPNSPYAEVARERTQHGEP